MNFEGSSFAQRAAQRWGSAPEGGDSAVHREGVNSWNGGNGGNNGGYGGGYGGHQQGGYGGGYGGNDRMGGLGSNLQQISWGQEQLSTVQKNFYVEHPETTNMTDFEVTQWRQQHTISVQDPDSTGQDIRPVTSFERANYPAYIMQSIKQAGFENPSAIQAQAWPVAMQGRDMIGISDTGSGKTLSFLLPGIVHINAQQPLRHREGPIALVLAPTRELAMQIETECQKFCSSSRLRTVCLYGGVSKGPQMSALRRGAEIVVATPGRLIDLLEIGVTNLKRVTYLCLDEADRMLDMGFEDQVRKICSQIRPDRQTLFFSATWPKNIQHLAYDLAKERPVTVTIGNTELKANKAISQYVEVLPERGYQLEDRKTEMLTNILANITQQQKVIIFSQTKKGAERLSHTIYGIHKTVDAIHGDKTQEERDWVLKQFRQGRINILVATDVAARGLDVKDVSCVINYDMPSNIEDYVHRIGRTGRAGATGEAVSFFSAEENGKMARDLVNILRDAEQEVPAELQALCKYGGGGGGYGKGGYGKGKGRGGKGGKGFGGKGGGKGGRPQMHHQRNAGYGGW